MDVGGTFVKHGLVAPGLAAARAVEETSIDSSADAAAVVDTFGRIISSRVRASWLLGSAIKGLSVSICGPFDYEAGISLMTLNKYKALHGVNLRNEFGRFLPKGAQINFIHDVQAFLLGQAHLDPTLGSGRVLAVTLGTGIGSAFMESGLIIPPGRGIPDFALGLHPFRAGNLEDFIGAAALKSRYNETVPRNPAVSVKEIATRAADGEPAARRIFEDFGMILGEAVCRFLRQFAPTKLLLGGQISQAFDLFEKPFAAQVSGLLPPEDILVSSELSRAALLGAVIAGKRNGCGTSRV